MDYDQLLVHDSVEAVRDTLQVIQRLRRLARDSEAQCNSSRIAMRECLKVARQL